MQVVASETIDLPRATTSAWQATAAASLRLSGPAGAAATCGLGGMAGEIGQKNSLLEGKMISNIFCLTESSVRHVCNTMFEGST